MNTPLPPYLRVWMYKAFGKFYGVNFDEIKDPLNSFRNFNQFFTRQLKEECRPIADPHDSSSLISPCDGRILSFGEVDATNCTIDCVKGSNYRLDEFLFGYQTNTKSAVDAIIQSTKERGNKTMYLVVYLAPKDYHRYHSPAVFTASYRRHIAGYLEPVDPRYLKTHRDVFKSNERVNVMGDWQHGFFAVSFVGATNVGSIHLHFDDTLATNVRKPVSPYLQDKNYASLVNDSGFWAIPQRKTSGLSILDQESHAVDNLLGEFDLKDILDSRKQKDFLYSPFTEH